MRCTGNRRAATSTQRPKANTGTCPQDELAETQIPSPGYSGAHDELALDALDYDVYEYFGDLEYGSDSYWDARIRDVLDWLPMSR